MNGVARGKGTSPGPKDPSGWVVTKRYDQGTSLFLIGVAAFVSVGAVKMGIGSARNPGMGFMPLLCAVVLGLLSLILFLRATVTTTTSKARPAFSGRAWPRVLAVLLALVAYAAVMPRAGYLAATFLLMGFLFLLLKKQQWWPPLVAAALASGITYYVFSVLLKGAFPTGFLGW